METVKLDETLKTHVVSLDIVKEEKIIDQISYDNAGLHLKNAQALEKKIKSFFEPHKQKAHELHKGICSSEKQELKPVQDVIKILKEGMNTFVYEQEKLAREKEQKIAAEAKKAEEEKLLAEAQALQDAGHKELAEEVIQQDVHVNVEVKTPDFKTNNVRTRTTHHAKVTSLKELMIEVLEGRAPRNLITVDFTALNKLATSTKGSMQIKGVEFYEKKSVY